MKKTILLTLGVVLLTLTQVHAGYLGGYVYCSGLDDSKAKQDTATVTIPARTFPGQYVNFVLNVDATSNTTTHHASWAEAEATIKWYAGVSACSGGSNPVRHDEDEVDILRKSSAYTVELSYVISAYTRSKGVYATASASIEW